MRILILFCLLFSSAAFGQRKYYMMPKPIGDTEYYTTERDTLYGSIEVIVNGGKVVGEGILVNYTECKWRRSLYTERDRASLDSFYKQGSTGGYRFDETKNLMKHQAAFFKTKDGYRQVEEEFIFNISPKAP